LKAEGEHFSMDGSQAVPNGRPRYYSARSRRMISVCLATVSSCEIKLVRQAIKSEVSAQD